jgi:DNA-binding PadR family transcriptional regulator
MRNASMGDMFGGGLGGGLGSGIGSTMGATAWEAMEQLKAQFDQKAGPRMGRGDVRSAVLHLLAEKPMHGYQIIQEIAERSGGAWKPSPGSVYPTLQLLADEGLISAAESNGRKTYSLTEEGRIVAEAQTETPWDSKGAKDKGRASALPKAGVDLAHATAQVGRSGTPQQIEEAVAVLEEAKRKIYSILAQ